VFAQSGNLAAAALALAIGVAVPVEACRAQTAPPAIAAPADQDTKFRSFLAEFRTTALDTGIDPQIYDSAMAGIARNPRVEALNLEQPEFVKPIWEYLAGAVSSERIANGHALLASWGAVLANIEQRFGVQKEILVAIWGIESDYGRQMGSFDMFEALTTLAYDGPRSDFGRRELLDALRMEQQERLVPAQMTSSWAGAFGQTQFLPSTFLRYAVDGDGDGRRDLWHSPSDALASAANLLAQSGWERGAPWGYEVTLPTGFSYELADLDKTNTISTWRNMNVRAASGLALPHSEALSSIYLPAGARGPAFIVYDNFRTVLKYNNAASYALAVCTLGDRLKNDPPIMAAWPRDEMPLTRDERLALQADLKKLGFDPGALDGVMGRQGRAALRAFQKARRLIPDGFATENLLERMERELAGR
jgi:membrane-bound lytic murein transglycosylase B